MGRKIASGAPRNGQECVVGAAGHHPARGMSASFAWPLGVLNASVRVARHPPLFPQRASDVLDAFRRNDTQATRRAACPNPQEMPIFSGFLVVPPRGIEPPTPPLPRVCSTPELRRPDACGQACTAPIDRPAWKTAGTCHSLAALASVVFRTGCRRECRSPDLVPAQPLALEQDRFRWNRIRDPSEA